jgi:hypothetical protein
MKNTFLAKSITLIYKSGVLFWLLTLLIFVDSLLVLNSRESVYILITLLLAIASSYNKRSKTAILVGMILLITSSISLSFDKNIIAFKSANWAYLVFVIGAVKAIIANSQISKANTVKKNYPFA